MSPAAVADEFGCTADQPSTLAVPEFGVGPELFRSHSAVVAKRKRFEKGDCGDARSKKSSEERRKLRDVDLFMRMMRERGGGNVALAWRRYFDTDGDGDLDFREFCSALADLQFIGNASQLWVDLGGSMRKSLCLSVLDPENAQILEAFGNWCLLTRGGPMEVFSAIDADGSDSLTREEFADGLRALGFYNAAGLPDSLASDEGVFNHLFPLLDKDGAGCLTPDELLFLERDKEKRERLQHELEHVRKYGKLAPTEPPQNGAQQMLHELAMGTTLLGGKHWKSLPPTSPALKNSRRRARHAGCRNKDKLTSPTSAAKAVDRQLGLADRSTSMPLLGGTTVTVPQRTSSGSMLQNATHAGGFRVQPKMQPTRQTGMPDALRQSRSFCRLPTISESRPCSKQQDGEAPYFLYFNRMFAPPYSQKQSTTMLPSL